MRPAPARAVVSLLGLLACPAALARADEAAAADAAASADEADDAYDADEGDDASTRVSCLDDVSPDGNPRKGVQKRPFLKNRRIELAAVGGLFASDVLSSSYTYGGALAFYPSEDFGVEAMVTYAPVKFRLEEPFTAFDKENRFKPGSALHAVVSLLYAPLHAKFKFSDATIVAGDLFLVGGAGRTFHDSVQGLTWEAGVGMKLYLWKYLTFRMDVRDFVIPQEILGRGRITNNLVVLAGFSAWIL